MLLSLPPVVVANDEIDSIFDKLDKKEVKCSGLKKTRGSLDFIGDKCLVCNDNCGL